MNVTQWTDLLEERCSPVFRASPANFFLSRIDSRSLLYSCDPAEFLENYPDSGLEELYGSDWPPLDIDYWLEVSPEGNQVRVVVEGWCLSERYFPLEQTSHDRDVQDVVDYLAGLLGTT